MANNAQLPFRQCQPGLGSVFGLDLANEVQSSSLLPGTNIAANTITSGNIAASVLQYTSIALTSAQIKAMYTTPVSVLAAPGAGYVNVIDSVCLVFTAGTQYTSGGAVAIQYHTGAVACTNTISETIIQSASSSNSFRAGKDAAAVANDIIEITNATGVFATGTGTAVLHVWYRTVVGV